MVMVIVGMIYGDGDSDGGSGIWYMEIVILMVVVGMVYGDGGW
jgi:hypothetical protein